MEVRTNTLTPELFLELYTSVGWEPPCIEQVQEALRHTIATFTAYHNHEAVGMVRLIGDGGMFLYQGFCSAPIASGQGRRAIVDGTFGKLHQKPASLRNGPSAWSSLARKKRFRFIKNGI